MPDLPTPTGKIFPRNLTARADHVVHGNPANTRPESGVDNCFPGLEFDQRNMDKRFFPGLTVDFHRQEGARVIAVTGGVAAAQGLTDADLTGPGQPLYLRGLCGRTTVDQPETAAPAIDARGKNGLDVWRHVHDLLPGRIAIVLGPGRGVDSPGLGSVGNLNQIRTADGSFVDRGPNGRVRLAVLVADRARFLDEEGVIDPEVYEPGDLTRSMCAPWQYDFRDCMCFYWAASKPDVSSSADGAVPQMNFLRADRTPAADRDDDADDARRSLEMDYPDVIADWNVLPVVLNDRENDSIGNPAPPAGAALSRAQVIEQLKKLAKVEHALCMEYLFAHYSLKAPRALPPGTSPDSLLAKTHAAAHEVFQVAVDEMRHLRWVNEALGTLGEAPVVGRATTIDRDGPHTVERRRLTAAQLDWFIRVEAPSQVSGTGVDGMYVQLHQTLIKQPPPFPEADRLAHLVKLIIDEGADHFKRFAAVKFHLSPFSESQYLRTLGAGDGSPLQKQLLDLSDQYYAILLGLLRSSFALGDRAGGVLIGQSRTVMEFLHQTNHLLASRGVGPRFTLPAELGAEAGPMADGQLTRQAALAAIRAHQAIRPLGDPAARALVNAQQPQTEALLALLDA
ncbi:LodA/GoxA family CTQ-dependent oxidase [Streptomyces sp. NBC_01233]|uniref:LodA/GoxA family CTQ-dependent oxidase n=1 Tax=Streptomyces sp. NBC_01233 TaxID=2903787 RepID=UPI002E1563BE|nr:LodA/GoxA family CTQ-dependent oxidase [Streptomyces sp. NBC_01233]